MGYNGHVAFNNIIGDLIDGNEEGLYCRTADECLYTVVHNVFKFADESDVFVSKNSLAKILYLSSHFSHFFNSIRICKIINFMFI